jgi:serine/threonine protein kinase
MDFYRKYLYYFNEEQRYLSFVEKEITKILIGVPGVPGMSGMSGMGGMGGIVTYYSVTDEYIDMELVKPIKQYKYNLKEIMKPVKEYLQSLGIMYIDWKTDNIGKSFNDNKLKLFDFNASGLINIETNEWIIKPVETFWNYSHAIKNGCKTPKEIDNYSFENFI